MILKRKIIRAEQMRRGWSCLKVYRVFQTTQLVCVPGSWNKIHTPLQLWPPILNFKENCFVFLSSPKRILFVRRGPILTTWVCHKRLCEISFYGSLYLHHFGAKTMLLLISIFTQMWIVLVVTVYFTASSL